MWGPILKNLSFMAMWFTAATMFGDLAVFATRKTRRSGQKAALKFKIGRKRKKAAKARKLLTWKGE